MNVNQTFNSLITMEKKIKNLIEKGAKLYDELIIRTIRKIDHHMQYEKEFLIYLFPEIKEYFKNLNVKD